VAGRADASLFCVDSPVVQGGRAGVTERGSWEGVAACVEPAGKPIPFRLDAEELIHGVPSGCCWMASRGPMRECLPLVLAWGLGTGASRAIGLAPSRGGPSLVALIFGPWLAAEDGRSPLLRTAS